MSEYSDFINEILEEKKELKKEVELIELKYNIIKLLIEYRRKNNMTQNEFAKKIGVKQQMVSRFEKGDVDPRLSFISKVLYGISINISFTDKDYVMTTNIIPFNRKKKAKEMNEYKLIREYSLVK